MKRSFISTMSLILITVMLVTAGCGTGGKQGEQPPNLPSDSNNPPSTNMGTVPFPKTVNVSFATGGTGGAYYLVGTGMSALAEKYLNLKMMVQTSSSSTENGNLLENKEVEFAICRPDGTYYSMKGEREFKGKEPLKNLRAVMLGHAAAVQVVTLEKSGIKTWSDMKGKRIALATQSSPAVYIARSTLEVNGIKEGDYKPAYLTLAETAEALKNGSIDVGFFITAFPTSAILDLTATTKVHFIEMEEEKVDELIEAYQFGYKGYMPANTYEGQDKKIWMMRDPAILMTRADVDEDLVYNLIKMICEKTDELAEIHPAGAEWKLETAYDGMGDIPLHPGAERYLREQGVF